MEGKLPIYYQSDISAAAAANIVPDDFLDLSETDPILSTSNEMMIKEAFRADKHFILAKIKTRSVASTSAN